MKMTDWLTALALGVALIELPLAYIWARRGWQTPLLRHAIDFDVLIDPADRLLTHELSLKYRDRDVERVSRTYLALWSRRGATINRSAILDKDPLRLELADGDVPLQARVVYCSGENISLATRIVDNQILLEFEFLDAGDGGVVEVLHQGIRRPQLKGTIKGTRLGEARVVGLTHADIGWMSDPSRWNRLKQRIRRPRRFDVIVMATVSSTLLAIGFFYLTGRGEPVLVDPSSYNLRTLTGQYQFSHRVFDAGLGVHSPIYWLPLISILALNALLGGLMLYIRLLYRAIPVSIVRVRRSDSESYSVPGLVPQGQSEL